MPSLHDEQQQHLLGRVHSKVLLMVQVEVTSGFPMESSHLPLQSPDRETSSNAAFHHLELQPLVCPTLKDFLLRNEAAVAARFAPTPIFADVPKRCL